MMEVSLNKWHLVGIVSILALVGKQSTADTALVTAYSLGAGVGLSTLRGDLVQNRSEPAVGGGFDFHSETMFFLARGYTAFDNSGRGMDIAIGAGNKWVKGGVSYSFTGASVPPRSGPVAVASGPLAGIVTADASRDIQVNTGALAPYLRITPVHTRNTLLNLDVWYGVSASGEEKVPVRVFGLPGHLITEPTKVGGMYGGSLQVTHRLSNNVALSAGYQWRTSRQEGGKARVSGDFLGLYEPVPVQDLKITNQAIMIGVALVNE